MKERTKCYVYFVAVRFRRTHIQKERKRERHNIILAHKNTIFTKFNENNKEKIVFQNCETHTKQTELDTEYWVVVIFFPVLFQLNILNF